MPPIPRAVAENRLIPLFCLLEFLSKLESNCFFSDDGFGDAGGNRAIVAYITAFKGDFK